MAIRASGPISSVNTPRLAGKRIPAMADHTRPGSSRAVQDRINAQAMITSKDIFEKIPLLGNAAKSNENRTGALQTPCQKMADMILSREEVYTRSMFNPLSVNPLEAVVIRMTQSDKLENYCLVSKGISDIASGMRQDTVKEFIRAVKLIDGGVLGQVNEPQKSALKMLRSFSKANPDLTIDTEKIIFVPRDHWTRSMADLLGPKKCSGCFTPFSKGSGQEMDYAVVVDSNISSPLDILKVLVHEFIHARFKSGSCRLIKTNPGLICLHSTLNEARTEWDATERIGRFCADSRAAKAELRKDPMKNILANLFQLPIQTIGHMVHPAYMIERRFLSGLTSFSPEKMPQAIDDFLIEGDVSGMRSLLGDMWDDFISIASDSRLQDKYLPVIISVLSGGNAQEDMRLAARLRNAIRAFADSSIDLTEREQKYRSAIAELADKNILSIFTRLCSDRQAWKAASDAELEQKIKAAAREHFTADLASAGILKWLELKEAGSLSGSREAMLSTFKTAADSIGDACLGSWMSENNNDDLRIALDKAKVPEDISEALMEAYYEIFTDYLVS